MTPDTTLIFNDPALLVAFISGTLIPILVALVTKWKAPAGLKAVTNAALSSGAAALATIWGDDCGCWQWALFVQNFFVVYLTSVATYYGLWKPTQVAAAVNASTPKFGLGPAPELEVDAPTPPRGTQP